MSRRKNTFSKAIRHLKESPTNSTSGVYSAVPGTTTRTETEVGPTQPDYSTIDWEIDGGNGDDTSGLFDGAGNHKLISPPGDNSYILGPMVSMYYTYASPHWTRIGYLRQSDRRMVNLGTITGTIEDWDGETDFQSYGQLTLEQAAWFKHTPKKPDGYRAFYPGPPSSSPDVFGRYYCTITGTPLATHNPEVTTTNAPLDLQPEAIFAAIMDRLGKGKKLSKAEEEWLGRHNTHKALRGIFGNLIGNLGDPTTNNILQGAVNLTRMFMDNVQFGGSKYLFKGLPSGIDYLPSFTGGNPFGGNWKWSNLLPKSMVGELANVQYFTPAANKSVQYSKGKLWNAIPKFWAKPGQVIAMPNTQAVRSWKNALKLPMSRGFGFGDVEKIVKTSDAVANTNVTRIFDLVNDTIQVNPKLDKAGKVIKGSGSVHQLSKGGAKKALQNMAKKGIKTMGVAGRLGRIVPLLNIPLVAADVTSRLKNGDVFGAVLGAVQIIPGPIGWTALGAQVAYDVEGHFNKNGFKGTVSGSGYNDTSNLDFGRNIKKEGYIMEEGEDQEQISTQGLGQALREMGLPKDKNEYIQDIGFYLLLQGVNPQFLGIYLRALAGKKLSAEQEQWVQENIPVIVNGMSDIYDNGEGEEPFYTEDDPWALEKQQTQESVVLSEERKLSILNSLKEPVVIPETKQKTYKVRPGRRGKTNFQGMDKLVGDIKPQKSFKEPQDIWSDGWQGHNARLSQDKKNIVLEKIGEGKQAWEYMLKYGTKMDDKNLEEFWGKNPDLYSYYSLGGKKYRPIRKEQVRGDYLVFLVDEVGKTSSMLQSKLNEKLSEESDMEMLAEYNKTNEPIPFLDDPLVRRVAKRLKTQIDYPDKPAVKGYPNEEPPKMVKGFHPELGKKYKYDKLDPVSAIAMRNAPTGDQEIDDNVKKSSVKPKVAEGNKSDWKGDLIYYSRVDQKLLSEVMTTSSIFDMRLEPEADQPVAKVDITAGPADYFNDVHWETYEESENYAPQDYRGDVEYTSGGTGSDLGGFSDDMITMAGSTVNYGTSSTPGSYKMWSSPMDMSKSDTISITVRAGNNSNGGMKPFMPMYAYLWSPELAKTGHETFGYHYLEGEGTHDYNGYQRPLFDPTDQSGSNTGNGISEHQTGNDVTLKINIPPEFRNKNNQIYFHASHTDWVADSDNARYGKHLGSHRLPVAGIDHFDLNDWPATGGGHWMHSLYSYISRSEDQMDETPSGNLGFENNYQSMGWTFWHNIQSSKHANWPMGQDANGGGIPIQIYDYANEQWEDWWINGGDPAPITGSVWGTNSSHHGGGDKATNADYEHIGREIYNKFKYAPLYGIKDISTNRTNPMSVLVGLDDPAASAFVRMGQELIALSPEQRRKKFQEMMDAAKEYQDKFLGKDFPGSNTTFGEVPSAPINWEEVQAMYDKENFGYQNWSGGEVAQIAGPMAAAGLIMSSGLTWGQVGAFISATMAVVGGKELLGLVNDGVFEMDDVISFMSSTANSDILWADGTYSPANDPYGVDQAHAGDTGNIDLDQYDAETQKDKEFIDNYDEKLQELKDKVKEAGQGLEGWQRVDDPGYQKALEELGNLKKERTRIRKARQNAEREAGQQYKDDKQQARDERAQQQSDRASERITAQRQREIAYQKAKELWNLRNPGKEFPVKPGDRVWQQMGGSLDMDYRPGGKTLSEEQGIEKIVKDAEKNDKNTMSQLHKDIARVRDISVKLSNANKEGDPEKISILKIEQNEAIRIYQTNKGLAKLREKENWKKQDAIKNSTFGRINAIRKRFSYKGQPTPSPDGFPTDPVQPPGPDGFSPKYAQGHENRYKRLDPQSAETMSRAPTGDPKIDNLVKKQAKKKK